MSHALHQQVFSPTLFPCRNRIPPSFVASRFLFEQMVEHGFCGQKFMATKAGIFSTRQGPKYQLIVRPCKIDSKALFERNHCHYNVLGAFLTNKRKRPCYIEFINDC